MGIFLVKLEIVSLMSEIGKQLVLFEKDVKFEHLEWKASTISA